VGPPGALASCRNEQLRDENGSTGLPDCRSYEIVSPVDKNGNQAGVVPGATLPESAYALSRNDGEAFLFGGTGPLGAAANAITSSSIARRTATGWTSTGISPLQQSLPNYEGDQNHGLLPSSDFSRALFAVYASFAPNNPEIGRNQSPGLYLTGNDELGPPTWLSEPRIADPTPGLGEVNINALAGPYIAGGSPDLSTVYFSFFQTLVPEDASRREHVKEASGGSSPPGFYEWRAGRLYNAGELPTGSPNGPFSQWGAVPAGFGLDNGFNAEGYANQVSEDGTRAYFVSPAPEWSEYTENRCANEQAAQEGQEKEQHLNLHIKICAPTAPELYVRKTEGEGPATHFNTVLLSKSTLAGHEGQPAPHGVRDVIPPQFGNVSAFAHYVYASRDGSRAFFESEDKLAKSAAREEPAGAGPWAYEYDLSDETLRYLPGLTDGGGGVAPIVASSADGSRTMFVKDAAGSKEEPSELDIVSNGLISPVTTLPTPGAPVTVSPVRATADGSVFVFQTNSPLPHATTAGGSGVANNTSGYDEIYRYELASGALACLSCAPPGTPTAGNANFESDDGLLGASSSTGVGPGVAATHGIAGGGSRVFFDTPSALVPQAKNGRRNVYEWENGHVYLLTSGTSPEDSFFLDNSESGNDVFFATVDGLVPGDTDGAFDVYDARVGGGFPAQVRHSECSGEGCQPQGLAPGLPAVQTANAAASGNIPAALTPVPRTVTPTRAQRLAKALTRCRRQPKGRRRACRAQAERQYGKAATRRGARRRS